MKRGILIAALIGAGVGVPVGMVRAVQAQTSLQPCGVPAEGGAWLNVYRWTYNVAPQGEAPEWRTDEGFDGLRYATEEDAFCGAARMRRTGVRLPGGHFRRESNIIPESITPFPALLARGLRIEPIAGRQGEDETEKRGKKESAATLTVEGLISQLQLFPGTTEVKAHTYYHEFRSVVGVKNTHPDTEFVHLELEPE